ncbi:MAG: SIS domain-containing protein [Candidatus Limnocylindrales bacterium]
MPPWTAHRFDPEAALPGPPEPGAGAATPELRSGPPWAMTEMIAAEPALAGRLLRRLAIGDGPAARLADEIRSVAGAGDPIRVVGCGTSEHGAQALALIVGSALAGTGARGVAIEAVQAFEASLLPQAGGLVIGISHEGGTEATIAALASARAAGSRTAVITADGGSPAAAAADLVIATGEMDASWCHTVGYLSPLLVATALAGHLAGHQPDADAVRAGLAGGADGAAAISLAAALAPSHHVFVIGSGADRPAARELALKIEEATWLPATMCDLETFLHGHLPAADAGTGLVLLLSDQDRLDARAARAAQALSAAHEIGLRAGAILGDAAAAALGDAPIVAGRLRAVPPAGLDGPAAALLATVTPLQLLTERLARVRGTNPDLIRRDQSAYLRASDAAR